MVQRTHIGSAVVASNTLAHLAGCEIMPGDKKPQGAVMGVVGGALDAAGEYLIGAHLDRTNPKNRDEAVTAAREAEARPARASDVANSQTADLNQDGYVTMDEVIAMEDAGLSDSEMILRLDKTNQIFELTDQQDANLRDRGISNRVITAMLDMNRDLAQTAGDRISQDR